MRPAIVKGTAVLPSGSLGASGRMQYHAIWHFIIRHISPFPEREWWQNLHFTFHTNQPVQGIFASSFQRNILSLLQSWYLVMWSGGHSREGTVFLWCSLQKINFKPPYSEAELWHFTQWPFPLAGALANYLTRIQSLCVCHPHIQRVAWSGWLQM